MNNIAHRVLACFRSMGRIVRIHRLPGGAEALERRLIELEGELHARGESIRCPACGSTDLEPTATAPSDEGERITQFRCKACGGSVPSTQ